MQFAVYHTIFFEDQLLVRPGGPVLDLLNGSTVAGGGGQPKNEVEVQAGYSTGVLGARLSADWKQATTVNGGAASPTGSLHFSDLATVNLRLFANFGGMRELVQRRPWLRGTRLTLSVNNLFNERIHVTAANGPTPLSYQPAYLDPVGRVVRLSLRKLFL
jgi:outer membrane receptor protein involved in Fe transport